MRAVALFRVGSSGVTTDLCRMRDVIAGIFVAVLFGHPHGLQRRRRHRITTCLRSASNNPKSSNLLSH